MPVIYESDEDKYYDKEDIKKLKKGNQSGIESRGSGIFIPGTKQGYGLYIPSRKEMEGSGWIDSVISVGKSVIEGIANNASTIGNVASAVGSVAGATSSVADAVKSIKSASTSGESSTKDLRKEELERIKKKMEQAELRGKGFKIT